MRQISRVPDPCRMKPISTLVPSLGDESETRVSWAFGATYLAGCPVILRITGAEQVVAAPKATTRRLDAEKRFASPHKTRSPYTPDE